MSVSADLEARTGVGVGGIVLYVGLLAVGLGLAFSRGSVDAADGELLLLATGLVYALGLLGVVSAAANLPELVRCRVATQRDGDGLIARRGTVRPLDGVERTPFLDEPAVCHRWRVLEGAPEAAGTEGVANEEAAESGVDGTAGPAERNASLVAAGESGVPFGLAVGGGGVGPHGRPGHLRVDPSGAAIRVAESAERTVGVDDRPPDGVVAGCEAVGVTASASRGVARRYEEARLAPGDEAFVLGRAVDGAITDGRSSVVADAGYPGRVADRVVGGLLLGVPTAGAGLAALLFVAGAL